MTQDATIGDRRDVSFEDMQVVAANSGGVYLHNNVGGIFDLRIRNFFPLLFARTVIDNSLHEWLLRLDSKQTVQPPATLGTSERWLEMLNRMERESACWSRR